MKNTLVRSVATAALVAGAALAIPSVAHATTTDTSDGATTHAAASVSGGGTPALGIWIGGGALALVGGAIAVGTTVRRHRQDLDA
ncbi:MAG: hypothetical protein BGO45_02890 [Microbacterium sp. 71-36]|mgnify:CR=1 FL=1|uniref:hypothetical protein n=1 Tax=unclassified Microbacterium TaxID=2609290 RepID=UPI00092BA1F3|nr:MULTISPECIES: hypothetical protein [unclassified Microbacterium]MBN9209923.1 hypothetical protein [Microbacterium sp.]OJV74736.1 MAG: hypothetical protein BGO45_02890 [Microbacterium sp. 71-36]